MSRRVKRFARPTEGVEPRHVATQLGEVFRLERVERGFEVVTELGVPALRVSGGRRGAHAHAPLQERREAWVIHAAGDVVGVEQLDSARPDLLQHEAKLMKAV